MVCLGYSKLGDAENLEQSRHIHYNRYSFMKKLLLSLSAVALLASCSSISKSTQVASLKNVAVNAGEVHPELEISQTKVKGRAKFWYVGPFRISGGNKYVDSRQDIHPLHAILNSATNKINGAALYNALENSEADVMIAPHYTRETHSWFFGIVRRFDVHVTGYPAKIKSLKQSIPQTKNLVISTKD